MKASSDYETLVPEAAVLDIMLQMLRRILAKNFLLTEFLNFLF